MILYLQTERLVFHHERVRKFTSQYRRIIPPDGEACFSPRESSKVYQYRRRRPLAALLESLHPRFGG